MLDISYTHPSWHDSLRIALSTLDQVYLATLEQQQDYLPSKKQLFSAFRLAKPKVNYILFGESPYPRQESANGYAFWDGAVSLIFSAHGLDKKVNRATSLRNIIKMLLVAKGLLSQDTSQPAISHIDKKDLITRLDQLFVNMQEQGILLLNASLVLSNMNKVKEAKLWQPFLESILHSIQKQKPTLILFGKIAEKILTLQNTQTLPRFVCEHPYNLSFIHNQAVLDFFKPFDLLACK